MQAVTRQLVRLDIVPDLARLNSFGQQLSNEVAQMLLGMRHGSPEWQKIYFRLRNSVEGYNGYAKDPLAEGIESAGSRRIRGIAAQTILRAFQLATRTAARSRSGWTPCHSSASPHVGAPHHRRPKKEPRSWTPTGHLAPAA
jgi:hypothetical protein